MSGPVHDDTWKERLGGRVRGYRKAAHLTVKALAERSGLSSRFLSQVESGKANPSLASLRELSSALDVTVEDLIANTERTPSHRALLSLIEGLNIVDADRALALLQEAGLRSRAQPIALLGLRGAGKSTVGPRLAQRLGRRFVEVDRRIEEHAGMPLGDLFEMHGEARYRDLERELLSQLLGSGAPLVLATGGGVVTHPESFSLLKRLSLTVWLKAAPAVHWTRVIEQGDRRPMAGRRRARAELEALYESRAAHYATADVVIDTTSLGIEEVCDEVQRRAGLSAVATG